MGVSVFDGRIFLASVDDTVEELRLKDSDEYYYEERELKKATNLVGLRWAFVAAR